MKNYVVKAENITDGQKGLLKYCHYLTDGKHEHHEKTKQMKELINTKSGFFKYAKMKADNAEIRNTLARKGGKPISNFAKSLTLDFPPFVKHPANEVMLRKVLSNVIQEVYDLINQPPMPPRKPKHNKDPEILQKKILNYEKNLSQYQKEKEAFESIDFEEFKKSIYAVWHNQKNEHIHLTFSSYIGKKNMRIYKTQSFLNIVKKSFTRNVDEVFGQSVENYKPTSTEEAYTPKKIKADKFYIDKMIKTMRALVKRLIVQYPEDQKFLSKIIVDLDNKQTKKANAKLEKFNAKHNI